MKKRSLTKIISLVAAVAITFTGIPYSSSNAYAESDTQQTDYSTDNQESDISSDDSIFNHIKEYNIVTDSIIPVLKSDDGEVYEINKSSKDNDEVLYRNVDIPEKFDLREKGLVASLIEDQNPTGTCWAHAAIESCESNMIRNGYADTDVNFSETHLMWFGVATPSMDKNDPLYGDSRNMGLNAYSNGASSVDADYALSSGRGLYYEADMPDITVAGKTSPGMDLSEYEDQRYVSHGLLTNTTQYDFEQSTGMDEKVSEDVKIQIMNTGAMAMYYGSYNNCMDNTNHSQYCPAVANPNHAVTVIGWDDNFSKDKFKTPAPGDGAWICKNSWGDITSMDEGCFYLSYYDKTLVEARSFEVSKREDYKDIYQYCGSDDGGLVLSSEYSGYAIANIFTAKDDTPITAVGFDTAVYGAKANIDIYTGVTDKPTSGKLVATKECKFDNPGYHTIDLDELIDVQKGEQFSVVIKVIADENVVFFDNHSYNQNSFLAGVGDDGNIVGNFETLSSYDCNIKAYSLGSVQNRIKSSISSGTYYADSISVELSIDNPIENAKIYYTLDGSEPDASSNVYSKPIEFNISDDEADENYIIKARAISGTDKSKIYSFNYKLSRGIKIRFNADGGTVSVNKLVLQENDRLTNIPIPFKEGKDFAGWRNEVTGKMVFEGQLVKDMLNSYEDREKIDAVVLKATYTDVTLLVGQSTDITNVVINNIPIELLLSLYDPKNPTEGIEEVVYKVLKDSKKYIKFKVSKGKIVKDKATNQFYLKATKASKKTGDSYFTIKYKVNKKWTTPTAKTCFKANKFKYKTSDYKILKSKGSFNVQAVDSNKNNNYPSPYYNTFKWDIKNPKSKTVATIDDAGLVTIQNTGSATIYLIVVREGMEMKKIKIKLKVKN